MSKKWSNPKTSSGNGYSSKTSTTSSTGKTESFGFKSGKSEKCHAWSGGSSGDTKNNVTSGVVHRGSCEACDGGSGK